MVTVKNRKTVPICQPVDQETFRYLWPEGVPFLIHRNKAASKLALPKLNAIIGGKKAMMITILANAPNPVPPVIKEVRVRDVLSKMASPGTCDDIFVVEVRSTLRSKLLASQLRALELAAERSGDCVPVYVQEDYFHAASFVSYWPVRALQPRRTPSAPCC